MDPMRLLLFFSKTAYPCLHLTWLLFQLYRLISFFFAGILLTFSLFIKRLTVLIPKFTALQLQSLAYLKSDKDWRKTLILKSPSNGLSPVSSQASSSTVLLLLWQTAIILLNLFNSGVPHSFVLSPTLFLLCVNELLRLLLSFPMLRVPPYTFLRLFKASNSSRSHRDAQNA